MPAGVITSQAMIASASSTSGVPKLRTSRERLPAPRSSTGTSSAAQVPERRGAARRRTERRADRDPRRRRRRRSAVRRGARRVRRRRRWARRTRWRAGQRWRTAVDPSGERAPTSAEPASGTTTYSQARPAPEPGLARGQGRHPQPGVRPARRAGRRRPRRTRPARRCPAAGPTGSCSRHRRPASSHGSVHQLGGDVDGRRDVAVRREEQRAPDDESAHGRQLAAPCPTRRTCPRGSPCGSPPSSRVGRVVASMTRASSSTTGSFSQV